MSKSYRYVLSRNETYLSPFPLNVECYVKFKGRDSIYEGVFKRMVTKNKVIFFGNNYSITVVAKPPGSNVYVGEVSTVRIKETGKMWKWNI